MLIKKHEISFHADENDTCNNPDFWNLVNSNTWEPNTFKIFKFFSNENKNIVDIGAWIGPTVLYAANLFNKVYAIEPDRVAHRILYNIEKNKYENIIVFNGAINDYNGITRMGNTSSEGNSMSSLLFSNHNCWDCECRTLKSFFHQFRVKNCEFIKMDVEGSETIIIPDSVDFLNSFDHTLYISIHTPYFKSPVDDFNKLIESLKKIYSCFYLETGEEISPESLFDKGFISIVASKKPITEKWQ